MRTLSKDSVAHHDDLTNLAQTPGFLRDMDGCADLVSPVTTDKIHSVSRAQQSILVLPGMLLAVAIKAQKCMVRLVIATINVDMPH